MEVPAEEESETFVTISHDNQPEQIKLSDIELRVNDLQRDMIAK